MFNTSVGSLSGNATTSSTATEIRLYDSTTAPKFTSKSNAYDGATFIVKSGPAVGDVRTITGYNGTNKRIYVDLPLSNVPTENTNFSIVFSVGNIQSLVNVNSSLEVFGSAVIDNKSKQSYVANGQTFLTATDNQTLIYPLGNKFVSSMSDSSYATTREYRGRLFASSGSGPTTTIQIPSGEQGIVKFPTVSSNDEKRENFTVLVTDKGTNANISNGEIISITSTGRTVSVAGDANSVTFTTADLLPFTATIFSKLEVNNADDSSYVRRIKTLVEANTAALGIAGATATVNGVKIDLTEGQIYIPSPPSGGYLQPFSLYVSDIKRIVKIINVGASTPVLGDLTNTSKDVTNNFLFFNGQKDSFYDHAMIKMKPGASPVGGLWILFDHYSHSGGDGYFNIESYVNEDYTEIPRFRDSKGIIYSLRDCMDFRPSRKNATTDFLFNYTGTPGPSNSVGLLLPQDTTNITFDYEYYLGRKDLLVMTKDAELVLQEGTPSLTPAFPPEPTNGLVLARLTHEPYTEFVPGESSGRNPSLSVVPVQHKNWQMKDITDINDRINNIEYYTALSLVEQNAAQLQIKDNFDLNRFKNGILVDNFTTFSIADTYHVDFSSSINTRKGILAPAQTVKNFQLQNLATLDSINKGSLSEATQTSLGYKVHKPGRSYIMTLQYTEKPLIVQSLASRTYDVNSSSSRITEGVLDLTPPMDNWIDTQKEPALLFVDPTLSTYRAVNSLNLLQEGDWQAIPGTRVSSGSVQRFVTYVERPVPEPDPYVAPAQETGGPGNDGW
jgi:hypothetical protein